MWATILIIGGIFGSATTTCVDLLPVCDTFKPVCIGSIINAQLQSIASIADQLANSSIPALEESLPIIRNGLPMVGSSVNGTNMTTLSPMTDESLEEDLKNSLPMLKESLPLIRESLPLLRESLPLLRAILDPLFGLGDGSNCQKRSICKSCKECPKLRRLIQSMIESICPATCMTCTTAKPVATAAQELMTYYVL